MAGLADYDPAADPAAVVTAGRARFTVLASALLRLEWSPTGVFEDRPSLAFLNRRLPVPRFQVEHREGWLILRTDDLALHYGKDAGRFDADTLRIELRTEDRPVVWHPGADTSGNLGGTCRTLDGVSGAADLEPGLLSRDGWAVVDDSARPLLDDGDWPWATPRENAAGAIDWYFFGHGHDYARALRDFTAVAGSVPLPPRYVFGAWWSRYWPYSDRELIALVEEFREQDVPLDVLIIDMDWHLEGWTGYTWNPRYFADPEGFLRWAHKQGLRVTLNLHPADGVGRHEKAFADVARAMGLDPRRTRSVPFDCVDPTFVEAYFRCLHHPREREGVDFWWIDWQQGTQTRVEGLDPLWWLNYLHWTDMERNPARGDRRPLIFSRWGGLGGHRYPIGFSGDTYCNWASLAFQPAFTATAGNVGFGYWSHDIGGHQPGPVEAELYVRWIQWGAFSPVLRTHASRHAGAERRIWRFPPAAFRAAQAAFHRRYSLLPYIYTAARQCHDAGIPLCRPLYHFWPGREEAYRHPGEYLFGDDMLVSPAVVPGNPVSGCAEVTAWIPPGEWVYEPSGRVYRGPAEATLLAPLEDVPVFVRGGAAIARQEPTRNTSERPGNPLIIEVWPGSRGGTQVYEDDGESTGYASGACAWTAVRQEATATGRRVVVGPAEGEYPGMPRRRAYEIHLRESLPPDRVTVNGRTVPRAPDRRHRGWWYDPVSLSTVIRLSPRATHERFEVEACSDRSEVESAAFGDGLRGQLRLIERVDALLGRAAQADVARVREGLSSLTMTGDALRVAVQTMLNSRFREAVQRMADAPEAAGRAVMQLLNLGFQVTPSFTTAPHGRIVLDSHLFAGSPCDALRNVRVSLSWESGLHWALESGGQTEWNPLHFDQREWTSAVLSPAGLPQTTRARAALRVQVGEAQVDLAFEHVLLPSVNRWWLLGPLLAPKDNELGPAFPPEEAVDLAAVYPGRKNEPVTWRSFERRLEPGSDPRDEFVLDWQTIYGRRIDAAVTYAMTYIVAPAPMEVSLAFGFGCGAMAWLNGRSVYRREGWRPYLSHEDRVPVRLSAGLNTLLLKIAHGDGWWSFGAHVETPDGEPLPELTTHLTPRDGRSAEESPG